MAGYLRKLDDGFIYPRTDALAERKDMVPCDKEGRRLYPKGDDPLENSAEMEIAGKNFAVPNYLVETVEGLMEAAEGREKSAVEKEAEDLNDKLVKSMADLGDATKENMGLKSDLTSTQDDLSAANSEISDLKKTNESLLEDKEALEGKVTDLGKELKAAKKKK